MLVFIPDKTKLSLKYDKVIEKEAITIDKYRIAHMTDKLYVPLAITGLGEELKGKIVETKRIKHLDEHKVPLVFVRCKIKGFKRVVYIPVVEALTNMPLYALSD